MYHNEELSYNREIVLKTIRRIIWKRSEVIAVRHFNPSQEIQNPFPWEWAPVATDRAATIPINANNDCQLQTAHIKKKKATENYNGRTKINRHFWKHSDSTFCLITMHNIKIWIRLKFIQLTDSRCCISVLRHCCSNNFFRGQQAKNKILHRWLQGQHWELFQFHNLRIPSSFSYLGTLGSCHVLTPVWVCRK